MERKDKVGVVVLLGEDIAGQMSVDLGRSVGIELISVRDEYEALKRLESIWKECDKTVPRKLTVYVHFKLLTQKPTLISALTCLVCECDRGCDYQTVELVTYGIPFDVSYNFCTGKGGHSYVRAHGDQRDTKVLADLDQRARELGLAKAIG